MALKKNDTNKIINSTISNNNSNNIIINESFQSNKIKGSKSIKSTTKMKENKLKISNKSTFDKKTKNKIIKKDIKKEGLINKKAKKIREKIVFDLKLTNKEKEKLRNLQVQSQKSSDNIFINNLDLNKKKIFTNLLEKHKNLYNKIKKIQKQKNYFDEYSLNNLKEKNIFYKNIQSYNIKHLENNKNNILQKISYINGEIKDFNAYNNTNLNDNSLYKDGYLEKISKEKSYNDINKKIINLKIQSDLIVQKIKKGAEEDLKKKNKEKDLIEKEEIQKKQNELLIKKSEEKKIEEQRKQKINSKMEIFKSFINNNLEKGRNHNYLYMRMATSFYKKEKNYKEKILKNRSVEEKEIIKELDNKEVTTSKKEGNEGFQILQQIWKERSELLPKYISPMYQKVLDTEENIKENEKNKIENKKRLIIIRQKYGKEKVRLPLISQILKKEREKKEIKYKIKDNKIHNVIKLDDKIKNFSGKNINKNIVKSNSCIILDNNKSNAQKDNSKIKLKKIKLDGNNLDEIKQNKILNNNIKENKSIDIKNNNHINIDKLNVEEMKGKIEVMEDQYKRGKELLKVKGGYIQNKALGDKMNNILIDSIKNKLDIIEKIYNKNE